MSETDDQISSIEDFLYQVPYFKVNEDNKFTELLAKKHENDLNLEKSLKGLSKTLEFCKEEVNLMPQSGKTFVDNANINSKLTVRPLLIKDIEELVNEVQ